MEALEKLMEGRTVITITHRLSTIADYDKIFVIRDGRIEEQGTHAELITQGKLYADLYHVQPKTGTPNVTGQVAEEIKTDSKLLN
jgi:subfamily B ATP-binding cassette protein MsbA